MTFYRCRERDARNSVAPAATHGPSACGMYTRRATGDNHRLSISDIVGDRARRIRSTSIDLGGLASFGHVHLHLHVEPLRAPRRNRPLHALP
jgi:hypothetical protein